MAKGLIIFDVGGVFRDSSRALDEGYRRGYEKAGLPYNFSSEDTWHLRGLGKYNSGASCINALVALTVAKKSLGEILSHDDPESTLDDIVSENMGEREAMLSKTIIETYKSYFKSEEAGSLVKIFPDASRILSGLRDKGYALAIFTNSAKATIKRDLADVGIEKFSLILSEEDVKQKKPSGEGILKAMKELNFSPEHTYYVGDAVSDIMAAKDAGCKSIAVLWGMGTRRILEKAKPDYIFNDIKEMAGYFMRE